VPTHVGQRSKPGWRFSDDENRFIYYSIFDVITDLRYFGFEASDLPCVTPHAVVFAGKKVEGSVSIRLKSSLAYVEALCPEVQSLLCPVDIELISVRATAFRRHGFTPLDFGELC
jgi:hypothetical protein